MIYLPPWQRILGFGSVDLFVYVFVFKQHYSKRYKWITIKFYGEVQDSTRKNWLNYGGDSDLSR